MNINIAILNRFKVIQNTDMSRVKIEKREIDDDMQGVYHKLYLVINEKTVSKDKLTVF